MTRFMMSLDDAVNLVLFAYKNGHGGDTFVQKAPAATIGQLAQAIKKIFNSETEVRVIGTRHGEKKHETLLNREEMVRAEDLGTILDRLGCPGFELLNLLQKGPEKNRGIEYYLG